MDKIKIWLDVNPAPSKEYIHLNYASTAIVQLITGNVELIDFGYKLCKDILRVNSADFVAYWILEEAKSGRLARLKWKIHTDDPIARNKIQEIMEEADKVWNLKG